jgi:hypothetical protein
MPVIIQLCPLSVAVHWNVLICKHEAAHILEPPSIRIKKFDTKKFPKYSNPALVIVSALGLFENTGCLVDFCRPAVVLNLKQPAEILPK